jgi:hypothetical protein
MPAGRPSKYNPVYCDEVIELSKDGASEDECALTIGVCPQTFENWKKEHPQFLDACTRAKAARKVWWEKAARSVALGQGSAAMVQFALTNIAPHEYRNKADLNVGGQGDNPVNVVTEIRLVAPDAEAESGKTGRK